MRKFKNLKLSRKIIAGALLSLALGGTSSDLVLKTYATRPPIIQLLDQNRQYTKEELLSMMEAELRTYEDALNRYEELYNQTFPEGLNTYDEMTDCVNFKHRTIIDTIKVVFKARMACQYFPGALAVLSNMNDRDEGTSLATCWAAPNGRTYCFVANSPILNSGYLKMIINFLRNATNVINNYIEVFNTDLANRDTPNGLNTFRNNLITRLAQSMAENAGTQSLTAETRRGAAAMYWNDVDYQLQVKVLTNLRSIDLTYYVIGCRLDVVLESIAEIIQEQVQQENDETENASDTGNEIAL